MLVMDLVRTYYATHSLTAPPYRLEYIYKSLPDSNPMRAFVLSSAAWRAVHEPPLSESMKALLAKNGALAADFVEAILKHAQDPVYDVRATEACEWHVHHLTPPCDPPASAPTDTESASEASSRLAASSFFDGQLDGP